MKIWKRIGFFTVTLAVLGACSAGAGDETTEDGWGELRTGQPMTSELALDTDVDEADLDVVDPVDDEDTVALDDFDLEATDDDSPDILVDDSDEVPAPVDHTELPEQNDVMLGCSTTGKYPKYAKGAQLVTTEWLNLRSGPGVKHARIKTMAPGTAVAVLGATCGHAWAHIKDSHGHVGYSAVQWLRPKQKAPPPSGWSALYSPTRGKKLAAKSWQMWHGSKSHGYCLKGVRMSIAASISPGFATGSPGAHQFGVFARSHRAWMSDRHLKVYGRGESGAPSPSQFPAGTVMVFSRGRCGTNASWGHVEIVINPTTACSDHCRKRTDKSCGPDTILVPRK
jgi:hypothetical protein